MAGPQEIDQIPALGRRDFSLEGGHATEAVGDGSEDMGIAPALYQFGVKPGRRRFQLRADLAWPGRSLAVAEGAVDLEQQLAAAPVMSRQGVTGFCNAVSGGAVSVAENGTAVAGGVKTGAW